MFRLVLVSVATAVCLVELIELCPMRRSADDSVISWLSLGLPCLS